MSLHGTGVRLIVAVHRDSTDELVAGLRDSVVIKQLTVCILHQPTAKSIAISLCYHVLFAFNYCCFTYARIHIIDGNICSKKSCFCVMVVLC